MDIQLFVVIKLSLAAWTCNGYKDLSRDELKSSVY